MTIHKLYEFNNWHEPPDEDTLQEELELNNLDLELEPNWDDVDWSEFDDLHNPDYDLDGVIK